MTVFRAWSPRNLLKSDYLLTRGSTQSLEKPFKTSLQALAKSPKTSKKDCGYSDPGKVTILEKTGQNRLQTISTTTQRDLFRRILRNRRFETFYDSETGGRGVVLRTSKSRKVPRDFEKCQKTTEKGPVLTKKDLEALLSERFGDSKLDPNSQKQRKTLKNTKKRPKRPWTLAHLARHPR